MNNTIALYKTTRVIWYVAYVIEALLITRFVLKLLGANPAAGFTDLIYSLSTVPLAPFLYVFGTNSSGTGIIEWSTLLAMLVYWFIAWGIVKLVLMNHHVPSHRAEQTLGEEERL
ncbi:MAG: YggT family protein [Candidatus Paceibacterota bacterium]